MRRAPPNRKAAFDQQVEAEAEFDGRPLVVAGDDTLAFNAQTAARKFGGQELFAGRFEEAGAEVGVDMDRRVDDVGGDLVDRWHR